MIIDRGTPRGSRIVKDAREQLLMLGRREKGVSVVEIDGEHLEVESKEDRGRGCFVLAPCAHDGACPLHNSTNLFCHFAQRGVSIQTLRVQVSSSFA